MDTKELTAEDIDLMEAGPEMDALVFERVMQGQFGWQPEGINYDWLMSLPIKKRWYAAGEAIGGQPAYSRDIAAAWQVVEHMLGINDQTQYLAFINELVRQGPIARAHVICPRICRCALKATIQKG
jgi:hypothetical protein